MNVMRNAAKKLLTILIIAVNIAAISYASVVLGSWWAHILWNAAQTGWNA